MFLSQGHSSAFVQSPQRDIGVEEIWWVGGRMHCEILQNSARSLNYFLFLKMCASASVTWGTLSSIFVRYRLKATLQDAIPHTSHLCEKNNQKNMQIVVLFVNIRIVKYFGVFTRHLWPGGRRMWFTSRVESGHRFKFCSVWTSGGTFYHLAVVS